MQVVHERCCGLDVHKKKVVGCVITPEIKEIRTFGTMTDDLESLIKWILGHECTHVAMESTGVFWKPIFNLLEDRDLEALVVNAQHIKQVPGRKTDVRDAEWIADLLRHGLLKGSYIPDRNQRELRELVRYRKSLVRERANEVNRLQKVLEGANIKLASVASDVVGVSGRAILTELIGGKMDESRLKEIVKGRLRNKTAELKRALHGVVRPHQQMMLAVQLRHIDHLDELIEEVSAEIEQRMRPFDEDLRRIQTIPGIGERTAELILAEIGTDMSRFPSAQHLASWAGMCPGNNESAGKRRSGKTRKGDPWLREALIEAARGAARTKNTYLSAKYHRIAARRGSKRAAVAVGHYMLIIIYHMLVNQTEYEDLGPTYHEERNRERVIRRHLHSLEKLGLTVIVQPTS
ncbi:IS110 family transposase (plasmid) [Alicyclobacillus fastidiosus]|uniref:IS110 family transposase n=1 Tax=Alicyclobacillus fastidiosus TaxID=392011 RepID=A0ABY6ZIR1_9BACL|nr:IS110 family transposase [Alicyclobacillus fastidiosus]WAH41795.1 IS110 family transposase [Alicyclobacillus fastidiosus]WAH44917.1 IS110 family transposase [Alicyclobacillus fastidiosus]GMA63490.1 IS110 family transposase [Alicyclobacillus fastidiosus]GMA63728.1 IS110 family transposase [Alicyclobacillus fastidiosus]GMA65680.1 IS110 family transposase [Alicyclobacillus fastidiosus]